MKYVILVSHGTFAQGLHNALGMLVGVKKEEIRSTGLLNGMSMELFEENFLSIVKDMGTEDRIILLSDIIGGAPMTAALNILNEKGFSKISAFGGMNLAMGIAAVLEDDTDIERLRKIIIEDGRESTAEFDFEVSEDEDI